MKLQCFLLLLLFGQLGFSQVGINTTNPDLDVELHILNPASTNPDTSVVIESDDGSSEIIMRPEASGSTYILQSKNSANGFVISEGSDSRLEIQNGGAIVVPEFAQSQTPNAGLRYPANIYVNTQGRLFIGSGRSVLDDLTVNTTAIPRTVVQVTDTAIPRDDVERNTGAMLTYTYTPTQDILLEVNYFLAVNVQQTKNANSRPDNQHEPGIYGAFIEVSDGVSTSYYAQDSQNHTGTNDGSATSPYHLNAHAYIPLPAGGTYTINFKGKIVSPEKNDSGWRAVFSDTGTNSRFQIIEHY